uniref:Putative secreted protein n=1 Tax=Panstrongylus lignarius TaxID=156445 RepID=A0A224XSQ7_9HEMI
MKYTVWILKALFVSLILWHSRTVEKRPLLLIPRFRFESNDTEQGMKVDKEKRDIYEKCIPYLKEKYREKFGERQFQVKGL